jgi:hypothetical protein
LELPTKEKSGREGRDVGELSSRVAFGRWKRKRVGSVKENARSKHEKDRWRMVEERRECVSVTIE